jgi:hypothetical protein
MRLGSLAGVAFAVMVAASACSKPQPTPPEVAAEYQALLQGVDPGRPGASAARLAAFLETCRPYEIAPEVEAEIDRLRSLVDGRYHAARELARQGDFDRAEAILEDLAHLPDTPDGASAREHLAFDFHLGKAQWLMVRQRWEESEEVARLLVDRDLAREQQEQVEMILDRAGHVGAARFEAVRFQARAACRHLLILLEMKYAEEGQFPARFSLSDVEDWDPAGSGSIVRALSSIEGYRPSDRGVSFTAVSSEGGHRIRIVDGAIEE